MQIVTLTRYMKEFGFTIPSRNIVVDDIRVRGTGSTGIRCETRIRPSGRPARVETVSERYGRHLLVTISHELLCAPLSANNTRQEGV